MSPKSRDQMIHLFGLITRKASDTECAGSCWEFGILATSNDMTSCATVDTEAVGILASIGPLNKAVTASCDTF